MKWFNRLCALIFWIIIIQFVVLVFACLTPWR